MRVRSYGMLPSISIPGTSKTLSGDSVAGLLALLAVGYGTYRFLKTR